MLVIRNIAECAVMLPLATISVDCVAIRAKLSSGDQSQTTLTCVSTGPIKLDALFPNPIGKTAGITG